MKNNECSSASYKFHSTTNLYKGLSDTDIKLEIYQYGSDAVEARLINTNYKEQGNSFKLQYIYFKICFTAYCSIVWFEILIHLLLIDIVLILWFMFLLWRLTHLVEFEKFILCYDFGIHLQSQKYLWKHNRFVPASYIHDIVVNEVIEDLDFRYLLILRTKGKLFNTNPIICVFKEFKPSFKCLRLIYKHINKVMEKNVRD